MKQDIIIEGTLIKIPKVEKKPKEKIQVKES